MFFVEKKLAARIRELKPLRYRYRRPVGGWSMKEDKTKAENYPPAVDRSWRAVTTGETWKGRDRYIWLRTSFQVPAEDERPLWLFDLGRTGGGNNSGFESLLFVNGSPYQGVDSNHREVFIDKKYAGQTIELALKLWSGLEGGGAPHAMVHLFRYADYAVLDTETDDLFYMAKNMLGTAVVLEKSRPERDLLLAALDRAFTYIDWSQPGSEAFYRSCRSAAGSLRGALEGMEKHSLRTVTAIGHTHIDVAWLWRLKHTREKAARSFSTVLRLMDQYPEYVFLQTQPQIYQFIKEDYPELFQKIKRRVTEGRWEIDGAMWLEADCNIPSGESLVRQILHGSRFIKKEFNQAVHYLWLPDVFGYSWALPQILKKSGIRTFMTTKLSWNESNRMPHDTFIWRGIDGSEILTHFMTTPVPKRLGTDDWTATYNGLLEPATVQGIYDHYRDRAMNNDLLLSYGYGDGGGGPTRDMLENRRRMESIPGLPHVRTGRARDYFEQLQQHVRRTDRYVHTWDGELYLEFHRGTYTSHAYVKKMNRKLELAYRETEFLGTLAMLADSGRAYPAKELYKGWTIILRNQFHDIIPGSAIHEVYVDNKKDYAEAVAIARKLQSSLKARLADSDPQIFMLVNSAGWKRNELVRVPTTKKGTFVDEDGHELAAVPTDDGYLVFAADLPALGMKQIRLRPGAADRGEEAPPTQSGVIETPFYQIKWNDAGQLTWIYDKQNRRPVLAEGGRGNVIQLFEDKPLTFDAWNIDIFFNEKKKELRAESIKPVADNGLLTTIRFAYAFGRSRLVQDMTVYRTDRRIDFKTHVDWQERQQLLKAAFDVDIRATEAVYQIQYGNVKRPAHWNTSWDLAKFETVAHQWVDFSERDYGVALLNNGKYGHDIKDRTMRISLLKGGISPDPQADVGVHDFTYSLFPHRGDFVDGRVEQEAWSLNNPITVISGRPTNVRAPLFTIADDRPLAIDAIKKQEDGDGLILRLHDHTGSRREITLQPAFSFNDCREVNLMEKDVHEPSPVACDRGRVTFILKPYEIKTLLFSNPSYINNKPIK